MKPQLLRRDRVLPDIAPHRNDGVMRWPNGDIWIPEPTPPQRSGLFGRATQADWERHARAATAQVRALARLDRKPASASIHGIDTAPSSIATPPVNSAVSTSDATAVSA